MALAFVDNDVVSPAAEVAAELTRLVPAWSVAWPDNRYIAVIERSDDPRSAAVVSRDGAWIIEWTAGPAVAVGSGSPDVVAAAIAAEINSVR